MKKFIILLFVFMLGNCVFALDYNVYKLDDGQTVIIKQVKNNPMVIIDTWVKTGSINENDQNNGISHFLEHLFFKGTETHPPGDFDKILESKGAITNAATSKDFTHYYITIPSKYFDLAMDLHSDMLLNPLVPRKEMEKERKVVMEEIAKDANNPEEELHDNLMKMMYKTHPYKRKVIGTNEIVGKLTREEILDYYNTHYGPQNMITIVIGDVDPQHALEKIKEDFKTSPRKLTKNINKPEKQLSAKQIKIDYQPVQSGYMLIGFRGVNAVNKDTYALDVLATILGEGRSSIFYQTIKDKQQLADSISASNGTYKEDGIFMVSADFTPENSTKLQKAVFKEIAQVQKKGVTAEQLQLAKNVIEKDTYFSRESIENISSEIGYTTVLTDNPKYYDEYLNNIKKVTASEVKKVANQYLNENKCAVSIVLPESAKTAQQVTETPEKTDHIAKLIQETPSTQKYQLDNGTTLLVTPNDLNDIVAISIYVKGGEFLEKIPGTGSLMGSVMMKGTQNYSSQELAQVLEDNGIKISPSASTDTFSIDVLTTKKQLPKTFEILNEVVNNATFNDFEIEKTKTLMLNSILSSRDVPLNVALENYKNSIFENSVYSYGSKVFEKTLPKIQHEDILEYYGTIFNPNNIVISVNGNITLKDIVNPLTDIFNAKPSCAFNYNDYASKIYPLNGQKTITANVADLKATWIIMGWQAAGVINQKDCATLQVIDSILGSGMSSRLFKNVREQEGLAYQLGSSFSPKILKSSFAIYIGTNPKTATVAKEKMLEEVNRLKYEFVSDKELQEAKDKIMGHFILSQETNLDKASTIGWFEVSGRGFAFKDKYEKLINSITASDIVEVANKYFNNDFVTSIVEGGK